MRGAHKAAGARMPWVRRRSGRPVIQERVVIGIPTKTVREAKVFVTPIIADPTRIPCVESVPGKVGIVYCGPDGGSVRGKPPLNVSPAHAVSVTATLQVKSVIIRRAHGLVGQHDGVGSAVLVRNHSQGTMLRSRS